MMSRFFAGGSDSESESESSEEELAPQQKGAILAATFAFSDDEEDVKRVVRSAREKRYEELEDIIKKMKNHKKIKDISNLLTGFENLTRAYLKAKPVIDKEEGGKTPKFYLRALSELDDFINECWEDREGRKNLSKINSKSLATIRQKYRKYSKDFEEEIGAYRENPEEQYVDDVRVSDDDDDQADYDSSDFKKETVEDFKVSKKEPVQDDSDADSIDWGEDESSSTSSDEDIYAEYAAARFLKKNTEKDDDVKRQKRKANKEKRDKKKDDGEWTEVKGGVPLIVEKPTMFAKDAEINHPLVIKKLNEILAARGKKGTDRNEQIELLRELLDISEANNLGPALSLKIRFSIISAIYDYNPSVATCMRAEIWQKCLEYVVSLLEMLEANPDICIGEHILEEGELLVTPPYKVRGCVLGIIERMDEEFVKILQVCDAHSPEYIERLKDETTVFKIILRVEKYLDTHGTPSELCRIFVRHIEHIYYKYDPFVIKKRNKDFEGETSLEMIEKLSKFIYAKDSTDRLRTQAKLYQIYHLALHDEWYRARDAMLMSHLQDSIHYSDVPTQILYNRALVQTGLCFFREGMIKDAHNALIDIQSSGRAKEFLAQGLIPQRHQERTPEQEKIEKRRQIPFHKQINLELLECVYLVSAMLQEIPYLAAHEMDAKKRLISKSFHHLLRNSERQALLGPPESMREHVVAASKALRVGNWKACKNYIINEKMNSKVWSLCHQSEKVIDMITNKIKEESLRAFLFTYNNVYDSVSIPILSERFELEKPKVTSIVSKMIIGEELRASLDEPSECVMIHKSKPTRLQAIALQLADKIGNLVDQNERLLEQKQGITMGRSTAYQSNYNRDMNNRNTTQDKNWNRRRNNK